MPAKRVPVNKEYSQKLKAIRPFVDFNYDLRKPLHSSQKAKINRYFEAINEIQARPNKVFRSKNRDRVRAVQEYGRNDFGNLPGIKVAFYESPAANPVTIKFRDDKLTAKSKFFDIGYIPFDKDQLITDPEREIQRATDQAKNAKWFRIAAGPFTIASPASRDLIADTVLQLMNRYAKDSEKAGKDNNHYFGNWLNGLMPMRVKNQKELSQFLIDENRQKQKIKRDRKRAKRRAKNRRNR